MLRADSAFYNHDVIATARRAKVRFSITARMNPAGRQVRIQHELDQAQKVLATARVIYAHIEDTLNRALALVGRVSEVYRRGGPRVRRLANQCFFDKLLISAEDDTTQVAAATLREPWATLLAAEFIQEMTLNTKNPTMILLVEVRKRCLWCT